MTTTKHGLTRRTLLSTLGFAGLAGALRLGLPTTAIAQEAKPTSGGILTFNLSSDPSNFDMLANTAGSVLMVLAPCYNGLVQYNPLDQNEIVGDLAESWEVSDDQAQYTFKLRSGVKFHDGRPMSADDVKFTFDIMRDPPEGYTSARRNALNNVAQIDIVDPLTVRFTLARPSSAFAQLIAPNWYAVLPKHILEAGPMTETVVGTGPFKLDSFSRGNSYNLVRNADYFLPDRPYLDGVQAYVVPDQGTAMSYFRSGQLNVFEGMDSNLAHQTERELADIATVQAIPNLSSLGLFFNTAIAPWNDVRVRKAAALSVDRTAAVTVNFRGDALLGGITPPQGKWALSEAELHAIPGYAPQPAAGAYEEAKALLAEAGFPDGLSTSILVRNDDRYGPWAIFLKDQLEKVGIRVTVNQQEPAVLSEMIAQRKYELLGTNINVPMDDPAEIFRDIVTCDAAANHSRICDDAITNLLATLSEAKSEEDRVKLSHELETKILSDYLVYPVMYSYRFLGTLNSVHGYKLFSQTDNNRKRQDIWIES